MQKIFWTCVFTLCLLATAGAQTATDKPVMTDNQDPLAVISRLFAEMSSHNPAGVAALFAPEAQLTALIKQRDGKSMPRVFTGDGFSKMFAENRGAIREEMYAPEVKMDGDLALVRGRYVFYVNDKLSHCGVNSFHLIRLDSGWKIANAASTIEPQGCTEREKAIKLPAAK